MIFLKKGQAFDEEKVLKCSPRGDVKAKSIDCEDDHHIRNGMDKWVEWFKRYGIFEEQKGRKKSVFLAGKWDIFKSVSRNRFKTETIFMV